MTESSPTTDSVALAPRGFVDRVPESAILLVLAAAALFLFGWGIGSYPLWDPWEPKYANAVIEMEDRGDLITPYLDGRIRWTKPILIYWAMYVPMSLLGNTELAVRLPSVLAGVLGVLLTYFFLSRLRGRVTGLMGAAILGTLPQYFYMSRQAMPDMLLVLWLTGAMGFFALARFGQRHKRRYLGAFYGSVALGFLTKGPVACVITLVAILVFWLIDFDPRRHLRWRDAWDDLRTALVDYRVGLGLLVFVVIAGPWYGAILYKHGYAFIQNFILDENIQRFQEPLFGHDGTSKHYFDALIHGTYPWASILPLSLLFLFFGRDRIDEEARQRWYFLSWSLIMYLIFTIAGTKLDHYIFPMMPALAVLVALAWESFLKRDAPGWVRPAFLFSIAFAFLPIRDFVFEGNRYIFNVFVPAQDIRTDAVHIDRALWIVFAAWAAIIALAALSRRRGVLALLAVLVAYGNGVYFLHRVVPAHASERSLKAYAELFEDIDAPDKTIIFYGWIRHSIRFYYRSEFRYFEPDELDQLTDFVRGRPNIYIIAQELFLEDLLDALKSDHGERWTVYSDEHPLFYVISNTRSRTLRVAPDR